MDTKTKKFLNFAIIIALISFSYAVLNYASSIEPSSFRSFTVSSQGEEISVPDIAKFNFTVVTEGGIDIGNLQEENTKKMNSAIQFVKDNNVDKKDIKTSQYNLSPRYQYYRCEDEPCPPPEIVGYTINQTVQVKIRDFENIGSILSGVVNSGANTVSQLNFTIDDPTEVENDAREKAIGKAKEKAEAIAKAGGFRLGKLLSIREGGNDNIDQRIYMEQSLMASKDSSAVPSIEPGSQKITVSVVLEYEIK